MQTSHSYSRQQVFERDGGLCDTCALDTEALRLRLEELDRTSPEEADALRTSYAIPDRRKTLWDMDHILPVADGGGSCGLDNLRTLCLWCHWEATGYQNSARAGENRRMNPPPVFIVPIPPRTVIHVLRKPLSEPTVIQNALKWGTGALDVHAGRIGDEERHNPPAGGGYSEGWGQEVGGEKAIVRWPSHLILSHRPGCKQGEGGGWKCTRQCPIPPLKGAAAWFKHVQEDSETPTPTPDQKGVRDPER